MQGTGSQQDRAEPLTVLEKRMLEVYHEWRKDEKVKNQPPDLTAGEFNRSE